MILKDMNHYASPADKLSRMVKSGEYILVHILQEIVLSGLSRSLITSHSLSCAFAIWLNQIKIQAGKCQRLIHLHYLLQD